MRMCMLFVIFHVQLTHYIKTNLLLTTYAKITIHARQFHMTLLAKYYEYALDVAFVQFHIT